MFTGIVEEPGRVLTLLAEKRSWNLTVGAENVVKGLSVGDSVAVNGCCLTAVEVEEAARKIRFDLLEETVRLTSFRILGEGRRVNLERSLTPSTRMGGHFVSGHVDTAGTIAILEERGNDVYLRVEPPPEFMKYVVYKGCIAVDGISLTVAEVDETGFAVWLIPHTLKVTNLQERRVGDPVNLEFDLLAKYVEKLLQGRDE